MLIAIMSDSHEHRDNLRKAVSIAVERGAEQLLFAGDLMAPGNGCKELLAFPWMIHFICGNNDGEKVKITKTLIASGHADVYAGDHKELDIDGSKIFMVHYCVLGKLIGKAQQHDLVIYGHDHIWHNELIGSTTLLNPWAILGDKEPASFALYNTQTKEVEKIVL